MSATPPTPDTRAAAALMQSCLVWDNHGCMPVDRPQDLAFMPQLQRYRASGIDAVMLNVGFGELGVESHLRTLAAMRHWLLARPDDYQLIATPDDIEQARATGRLAVGFDIEGANALGGQLSLLELYKHLGVRWMLLAYNRNNPAAGGCQDDDGGLTPFGRDVVAEMERVGLQLCLSHTGHRTVEDVLKVATRPVIFSHSNAAAVHAHPRNIPDELIRACAATGGVVGVNGVGIFLGRNDTSSAAMVRHIEHLLALVGPRHVAIGLDYVFDLAEVERYMQTMRHTFPAGMGYELGARFMAPEQLVEVVQLLLDRGCSTDDLRAVLGGNLMRLAREVWTPRRD